MVPINNTTGISRPQWPQSVRDLAGEFGCCGARQGVGQGVRELKIDFGPGYRIYFGRDGATIVILLAGGTKKRQQRDIEDAQARWMDYKRKAPGV